MLIVPANTVCFVRFINLMIVLFIHIVPVPTWAQESPGEEFGQLDLKGLLDIKLDVSSSKAKTIFNTPSTVSVITKDMIDQYQFRTVTDALHILAGFAVYPTYHKRDLPSGRGILQNQYSNKVLFLINGIPTWHAITGEGNFERIDINNVERIEILKGPASVLYGSNAYSAAVNVVVKSSSKHKTADFQFGVGDGYSFKGSGNVSQKKTDIHLYAGGGVYNEKGIEYGWTDRNDSMGTFRPYYYANNITTVMEAMGNSILFNATGSSQAFFGSDPVYKSGTGKPHLTDGYLLNYTFDNTFHEKLTVKSALTFDWNQVEFYLEPDNSVSGLEIGDYLSMRWRGYRLTGSAFLNYQISDIFYLEFGGDYDYRKSSDSTNTKVFKSISNSVLEGAGLNDKSVWEFSGISQIGIDYNAFSFLLGARLTKNEFFDFIVAPRGSFNFSINDQNCLKLIYGQSYRSPSFLEIHILSLDKTRRGNRNLKPEVSNSIELAYLTSISSFFTQILGYYATYEGFIKRKWSFDPLISKEYQSYVNGESFSALGIELECKYENPKIINFFLNCNYIQGDNGDKDNTGHYNFKYIPQISGTFGMHKKIKNISASFLFNFWDETRGHIKKIKPQYYFDGNFGYFQTFESMIIRHSVTIKNVLNKEILFPEYADRHETGSLNAIPTEFGYGRRIGYSISVSW